MALQFSFITLWCIVTADKKASERTSSIFGFSDFWGEKKSTAFVLSVALLMFSSRCFGTRSIVSIVVSNVLISSINPLCCRHVIHIASAFQTPLEPYK
jgi:hypothetical protein